jgi:hypothetical protein
MPSLVPAANLWGASWAARTWPITNYGIFVPFSLEERIDCQWMSSLTPFTSGNWDYGIYKIRGTTLSTAISFGSGLTGNNGVSMSNVSVFLDPGYYFLAHSWNNNTVQCFAANPSAELLEAHGVRGITSAYPLPTGTFTPTFDTHPQAFLPSFAMHLAAA